MSLSSLLCRQEGVIYISHPLKETLILGNQENREVPLNLHVEGRWYSGNLHTHSNVFSQPAQDHLSPSPHTGDRPHQMFPQDNWYLQCVFRNLQNLMILKSFPAGLWKD